jgi:hypothetical protein
MKKPVGSSNNPRCGKCLNMVSVGAIGFIYCPWCGTKIDWIGRKETKLIESQKVNENPK